MPVFKANPDEDVRGNVFTTRREEGPLTTKVRFYSLLAHEVQLDKKLWRKIGEDDARIVRVSMAGKLR